MSALPHDFLPPQRGAPAGPAAQPVQPDQPVQGERGAGDAAALPAAPGSQRWLWQGRFGAMLIEVVGDAVFVNGQRVQPVSAMHAKA